MTTRAKVRGGTSPHVSIHFRDISLAGTKIRILAMETRRTAVAGARVRPARDDRGDTHWIVVCAPCPGDRELVVQPEQAVESGLAMVMGARS